MTKLIDKWKNSLNRTRKVAFSKVYTILGTNQINSDLWDELEAMLLQADIGLDQCNTIIDHLKYFVSTNGITDPNELIYELRKELLSLLPYPPELSFDEGKPSVILIVGVNGSGKTTTVAKLGHYFKMNSDSILFAAADTFRAAASEQLSYWGQYLNIPVITGQEGSDPGAIAYDAIASAKSKNIDRVIIDTAGRLHTKYNLMEELKKVHRVVGKALPGAPHQVWLVLDATTGQNALQQAESFKNNVNITGVILSKLDTSAKGGMAFSIQNKLNLPIFFAGLGEKIDDLSPFDPEAFIDGILSK